MKKNIFRSKITITTAHSNAGTYKLTCSDCQEAYIGKTGRQIQIRYKELIQSIGFHKEDSKFVAGYIYLTTNIVMNLWKKLSQKLNMQPKEES
jgi:hypothetical protein